LWNSKTRYFRVSMIAPQTSGTVRDIHCKIWCFHGGNIEECRLFTPKMEAICSFETQFLQDPHNVVISQKTAFFIDLLRLDTSCIRNPIMAFTWTFVTAYSTNSDVISRAGLFPYNAIRLHGLVQGYLYFTFSALLLCSLTPTPHPKCNLARAPMSAHDSADAERYQGASALPACPCRIVHRLLVLPFLEGIFE
jgi:hypothetical protein